MASLAGMLQARGHHVTGSDQNIYPPMSTMLESLGIDLFKGYDAAHLNSRARLRGCWQRDSARQSGS